MSELTEFILARIAEDEAVAQVATQGHWDAVVLGSEGYDVRAPNPDSPIRRIRVARCGYEAWEVDRGNAEHIARHDPARVLAECAALREVVEWAVTWPLRPSRPSDEDAILRPLAAIWADHPDYRPEEWA